MLFDQPPKAAHESALLVVHLMVEDSLALILLGDAVNVMLGLGEGGELSTTTVTDSVMGPPSLPRQDMVKLVVLFNGPTVICPAGVVSEVHAPSALQLTELSACQVISVDSPSATDKGLAFKFRLAGPSVELLLLPPPPPQAEIINKAVNKTENFVLLI